MAGKKTPLTLARKSRKRRAPDDDQIEPIGQGPRKHAKTGSLLLRMPAEIRAKILRELLCAEEGLLHMNGREDGIPQIHTAILATCRQLHDEGIDLFHGNRINFHIIDRFNDLQEDVRVTMHYMSYKFSKIGFTIPDETDEAGQEYDSRQVIHEWAAELRMEKHWTDIRIEVGDHSASPSSLTTNDHMSQSFCERELTPFRILRRVEDVEVVGNVSPEFVQDLVTLIQGDTPVVELLDMYEALTYWLSRISDVHGHAMENPWDDILENAQIAAFAMDTKSFYECREEALEMFEDIYDFDELDLYSSDPEPFKAVYESRVKKAHDALELMVRDIERKPGAHGHLLADFDKRIEDFQNMKTRVDVATR